MYLRLGFVRCHICDVCMDMCIGMCVDMSIHMSMEMFIDMCIAMCADMWINMSGMPVYMWLYTNAVAGSTRTGRHGPCDLRITELSFHN